MHACVVVFYGQPARPAHTHSMEMEVRFKNHGGVRVTPPCHQMEWTDDADSAVDAYMQIASGRELPRICTVHISCSFSFVILSFPFCM